MIKVFYDSHCITCKKVFIWMRENDIEFQKINIIKDLNKELLMEILNLSENGTEDIISTKSKYMRENEVNFDEMTLNETIELILAHPTIIRRPIILSNKMVEIGFNQDDLTAFLPKEKRKYMVIK